jgi:hypothetical protein
MFVDDPNTIFILSDVEVETVRRAAAERGRTFDPCRREYSATQLRSYGIVREAYNSPELRATGLTGGGGKKNPASGFLSRVDDLKSNIQVL